MNATKDKQQMVASGKRATWMGAWRVRKCPWRLSSQKWTWRPVGISLVLSRSRMEATVAGA